MQQCLFTFPYEISSTERYAATNVINLGYGFRLSHTLDYQTDSSSAID